MNDTVAIYGKLPYAPSDFTLEDAKEAALVGASGIYHAVCHSAIFDSDAEEQILRELAKSAFFTLQALYFSRNEEYIRKKSDLAEHVSGKDAKVLAWSIKVKQIPELTPAEKRDLSNLLLNWSGDIIIA